MVEEDPEVEEAVVDEAVLADEDKAVGVTKEATVAEITEVVTAAMEVEPLSK